MIKTILLGSTLAVALSAAPAIAADHALATLQGAIPSPLPDEVLDAIKGGLLCNQDIARIGQGSLSTGHRTGQRSVGHGRTGQGTVAGKVPGFPTGTARLPFGATID